MLSVFIEFCIKKPANILQHDRTRSDFPNQPYCFWKQIALVVPAQLLGRLREWRAGDATCKQVCTLVWCSIKVVDISTNHIPMRLIFFKHCAIVGFIFN